ncbi:MAG: DUF86 domain-containing protein [Candidatus Riflebacteria bacterium]|nr:DUF86 domain-containing protein [Candidatus Riflebacteria bacterium]
MTPHKTDFAYLWDMREAAIEAVQAMTDIDREHFLVDSIRVRAVERLIEIIGEAAYHVSPLERRELTDIPWEKIVSQRHVLAHGYGEIDRSRLFDVVSVNLSPLIEILDKVGLEPSLLRPDSSGKNKS